MKHEKSPNNDEKTNQTKQTQQMENDENMKPKTMMMETTNTSNNNK